MSKEWMLKKVNKSYHEGPVRFHPETGDIYLTRTNYVNVKPGISRDRTHKLKLYKLVKNGDSWSEKVVDAVDFNSDEYSVAHACFTPDGQTMYFSSDMPGGYGGTDIWMATKSGDIYSSPVNLGPEVNTIGEEMYPYYANNELYYASSGHSGLGGLDIYASSLNGSASRNFGAPINSNYDDFGIVFNQNVMTSGYFTSNRPGAGSDDIYKFSGAPCTVKVLVYDLSNGQAVPQAEVKMIDDVNVYETDDLGEVLIVDNCGTDATATKTGYIQEKIDYDTGTHDIAIGLRLGGKLLQILVLDKKSKLPIYESLVTLNGTQYLTDVNGYVTVLTQAGMNYEIKVEKDLPTANSKYYPETGRFNTGNLQDGEMFSITAYLNKFPKDQPIEIKNIYYDLDKFNIRPDAAGELNNLVKVMKAYPTMNIRLGSHTDCRMPKSYNQTLSENRAKSAMKYLTSRGVSASRMTYEGYGESQTVNGCDCECDTPVSQSGLHAFRDCEDAQVRSCSDQDHQENRRTVFTITKF